ncbi:C-C motif chemokine 15-like isoform 2-T2 [Glossophaga mutica]
MGTHATTWRDEPTVEELELQQRRFIQLDAGVHHPSDCCLSHNRKKIQCTNMKDYYVTSSRCSQPGVIFTTRRGKKVCFYPSAHGVQDCMRTLASKNTLGRALAEKLQ